MTFFLIVPCVIIVGVFLVHIIFNRLGLRIHYGALIICALLSAVADAGAAVLSPTPDKFYFMRLGGFILSSAIIGTLANYFFVRREVQEQEEFSEEVRQAYQGNEDEKIEVPKEKIEPPEKVVQEEKPKPIKKVDLVKKSPPKKKVTSEKSEELQKKSAEENISKVKLAEKPQPAKVEKVKPKKIVAKEEISKPVEIHEEINIPDTTETLDELLDLAYSEKTQGHTWQAIAAYKKALEKYRTDSYAPFVAIDLGNIYKEQAMYAKAIKVFEDAMELPAVKRNYSTSEKFKKNIVYLKAVQSVLLRHQALKTPFSKISKIYLQEIESEFQAAQLKINS
ncbi:MAG: hypothetical protein IK062_05515 [Selenomonadaceae bacterium]|nr:hypothetical protein [Selenomonadaceae bacterium]